MNIYSIYVNPEKEGNPFISVQNCFSLTAAIFGVLWAIYHKMWRLLLVITIVYVTVVTLQNNNIIYDMTPLFQTISMIVFGIFATDMREYDLEKKGYKLRDIVLASSQIESEIKFLTRQKD